MLARAVASRRAALAVRAAPRIASRQTPSATRSISFWPFRKKVDPTLPVYFPKQKSWRQSSWKKVRYAVLTGLVYYALLQVYMSVVLDPLLDWADNEWDSLSEKEKQELEEQADDEEEDPLLFLPFPFTTKEEPQPPYKGTDPEWKEFLKINKDPKRQKEIRSNLADIVRRRAETNPAIIKLMGGKSTKVRKMWLDIIYPTTPPPKHYISGLIIDYDGIFWGERSIETLAANQLNSIMYPKAVALSVWTFWNVLIQQTKDDISKSLGLNGSKEQDTSWQSVMIGRGREQSPFGTPPKPSPATILAPPGPQGRSPQQGAPSGPVDFGNLFKKAGEGEGIPMSVSMYHALGAASRTLAKNWKPAEQTVNRGCIRVDGMIELQGNAALIVMSVMGWYDPQTKKYMNVQIKLKHLFYMKQKPLGGG